MQSAHQSESSLQETSLERTRPNLSVGTQLAAQTFEKHKYDKENGLKASEEQQRYTNASDQRPTIDTAPVAQDRSDSIYDILPTPLTPYRADQSERILGTSDKIFIPKRTAHSKSDSGSLLSGFGKVSPLKENANTSNSPVMLPKRRIAGSSTTSLLSKGQPEHKFSDRRNFSFESNQGRSDNSEYEDECHDSISEIQQTSFTGISGTTTNPFLNSKRNVSVLENTALNTSQNNAQVLCKIVDHPTIMPNVVGNKQNSVTELYQTNRVVSNLERPESFISTSPRKRNISLPLGTPAESPTDTTVSHGDLNTTVRPSKIYDTDSEDGFFTLDVVNVWELTPQKDVSGKIGKRRKYKKVRKLGSGNFSEVFLYVKENGSNMTNNEVACKHIKYPAALRSFAKDSANYKETLSKLESSLTRELYVLNKFKHQHPNIISLLGINNMDFLANPRPLTAFKSDESQECPKINDLPECYIFTDYCSGGDLLKFAKENTLSINMIQAVFKQIVHGVQFLHDNLIIHRDLKLENVLLTCKYEELAQLMSVAKTEALPKDLIKIADFGLCKEIRPDELCTTRCGSEDYVAPEILMGLEYDGRLTDCWALGVILYALLEDFLPFDLPARSNGSALTKQSAIKRNRPASYRIVRCDWKWLKLRDCGENDGANDADLLQSQAKEVVKHCLIRRTNRWNIHTIAQSDFLH